MLSNNDNLNTHNRSCYVIFWYSESDLLESINKIHKYQTLNIFLPESLINYQRYSQSNKQGKNQFFSFAHLSQFLGTTFVKAGIVLESINANLILMLSGMISSNGALFLFIKNQNSVYFDYFVKTLHKYNIESFSTSLLNTLNKAFFISFPLGNSQDNPKILFTDEQDNFIHNFFSTVENSQEFKILLTGPRGSGKTLLTKKVIDLYLEKHNEPIGVLFGSSGILNKNYHNNITEITRENYLDKATDVAFLIIEEAATLPLSIIRNILTHFKKVLLVSTITGYEGSGKGVVHILAKEFNFTSFTLTKQFRFINDNLDNFLNEVFFRTDSDKQDVELSNIAPLNTEFNLLSFASLIDNPDLLQEVEAILDGNHYENSPQDLIRWIDCNNTELAMLSTSIVDKNTLQTHNKILNLAIISYEGNLNPALSQEIFYGKRMPPGNLIPQTLLAHAGFEEAGNYKYARIERIVTLNNLRRNGLGKKLILEITKTKDSDFLGVSFALKNDTLLFWENCNFKPVMLGITPNKNSGLSSLVMLFPLTNEAQKTNTLMSKKFFNNLTWLNFRHHLDQNLFQIIKSYKQLGAELPQDNDSLSERIHNNFVRLSQISTDVDIAKLSAVFNNDSFDIDVNLLKAVAFQRHSIEHASREIFLFFILNLDEVIAKIDLPQLKDLIEYFCVENKMSLTAHRDSFSGKKEFSNFIRQTIQFLLLEGNTDELGSK